MNVTQPPKKTFEGARYKHKKCWTFSPRGFLAQSPPPHSTTTSPVKRRPTCRMDRARQLRSASSHPRTSITYLVSVRALPRLAHDVRMHTVPFNPFQSECSWRLRISLDFSAVYAQHDELQRAFKQIAKEVHPDRCREAGAHEAFSRWCALSRRGRRWRACDFVGGRSFEGLIDIGSTQESTQVYIRKRASLLL